MSINENDISDEPNKESLESTDDNLKSDIDSDVLSKYEKSTDMSDYETGMLSDDKSLQDNCFKHRCQYPEHHVLLNVQLLESTYKKFGCTYCLKQNKMNHGFGY